MTAERDPHPDDRAFGPVAICAATFRRPEGLRRLLAGLNALRFDDAAAPIEIVVVDNDPEGSAAAVCNGIDMRWPLRLVHEPQRGISHARNAALEAARAHAAWIAFIDDDEVPDPAWLQMLLEVQREHDADVVTGPVRPHYEPSPPTWIARGGFFDPPSRATGSRLDCAYTNNVLFRTDWLDRVDRHFDVRLALVGGEDREFFGRLHDAGATIVWAEDAFVTEWIPADRLQAGWLIRRMSRIGNAMAHVALDRRPGVLTCLHLAARGAVWTILGAAAMLAGLASGRATRVKGRRWIAYGAGLVTGIFGRRYEEYR